MHGLHARAAQSEFRAEAAQSLERAFAEGHSVDNAAVELKTLRMASNVPLREVREAVVGAIVEKVEVVEGDAAGQRKEIAKVVGRWGRLIDLIGGMDPVETVEVLQVRATILLLLYACSSDDMCLIYSIIVRTRHVSRSSGRFLQRSTNLTLSKKITSARGTRSPKLGVRSSNLAHFLKM